MWRRRLGLPLLRSRSSSYQQQQHHHHLLPNPNEKPLALNLLRLFTSQAGSDSSSFIKPFIAFVLGGPGSGRIVPSEITVELIRKAMESSNTKRVLIDGFPRCEENRIAFERMIGTEPDLVIFFDCPEDEMVKRLLGQKRTKAEPPIYYMLAKSIIDDPTIVEQNKEKVFEEWKFVRRAELTQFQKKVEEQYMSNVERQLERLQNARNPRRGNGLANMQEMDKELDTHRAEHGPKTRRIPEGGNDDEDVEDIAAEDELMDEVLGVNEAINEDPTKLSEEATDGVPVREVAQ